MSQSESRSSSSKTGSSRIPGGAGFPPVRDRNPQRGQRKVVGWAALLVLVAVAAAVGSMAGLMLVYSVHLPQIDELERYRPNATTDLYDVKGRIFGSFALERRVVVGYEDFSPLLRQAVLSIEDKNFESHWGVNVFRVAGAIYHDLTSSARAQGASTLTMQLARNLFLSSQRTFGRKLQEALLSIQIERTFTKQQIFTLYGNQIFLGHGVYGFEAGAEYYFSKHAKELRLPQAALLAGLAKGPSAYSPIANPDKALRRRNLVINAMLEDGKITAEEAAAARAAPLGLELQSAPNAVAPYFVDEVRRELESRLGADEVHAAGLRVYTTLDLDLQQAATRAVLDGLAACERRHGWKGHLLNAIAGGSGMEEFRHPDWALPPSPGDYVHALVTGVLPYQVTARISTSQPGRSPNGDQEIVLTQEDWAWTGQKAAEEFLKAGDIIYVHLDRAGEAAPSEGAQKDEAPVLHGTLEQDSGVEGALLAIDNASGDVLAMVGGRDFSLSQFNRATQAERQTGSSFKPYVYTAAVEEGAVPTDRILDAPVSFGSYTPHNYEGNYLGNISLLQAFADSRNIPAVKLADRVGMKKVIEVAHNFGITSKIPAYLPIALGAIEVTLQEQVAAYAAFPNDGLRIAPRLVHKVMDADGSVIEQDAPGVSEATSVKTARTMMVLLREVMNSGTGAAAQALHHPLGGKTGTTSDFTDAWFLGFSPSVTCGTWVGYDNRQSLGERESGAQAALPIWMSFMKAAIVGREAETFPGEKQKAPAQ